MNNRLKNCLTLTIAVVCLGGCTHLGQVEPPEPAEAESAVRTTESEVQTNLETPAISKEEAEPADVVIEF